MKHQFHCLSAAGLQVIIRLNRTKQIKLHFSSQKRTNAFVVQDKMQKKKNKKQKPLNLHINSEFHTTTTYWEAT